MTRLRHVAESDLTQIGHKGAEFVQTVVIFKRGSLKGGQVRLNLGLMRDAENRSGGSDLVLECGGLGALAGWVGSRESRAVANDSAWDR